MKNALYSILDAKMATFSPPFVEMRDAGAIRNFSDWVNDGSNPNNMLYKHPEDYTLYKIGTFDNETGQLEQDQPLALVTASAVKNSNDIVEPALNGHKAVKTVH